MRKLSGKSTYEKRKIKDSKYLEDKRKRSLEYYQTNRSQIRKKVQEQREAEPEKFRTSSKGMLFDVPISDMIAYAGNKCEICNAPFKKGTDRNRVIDHVHRTKRVRGILCRRCNLLLGHANDSIEILERSIAYLHRHSFMGND